MFFSSTFYFYPNDFMLPSFIIEQKAPEYGIIPENLWPLFFNLSIRQTWRIGKIFKVDFLILKHFFHLFELTYFLPTNNIYYPVFSSLKGRKTKCKCINYSIFFMIESIFFAFICDKSPQSTCTLK